ncbi:DUF742 domain-containing protein [Streptomyces sp. NPDC049577]|uniref:DUF742 domain-containing protein n=1 Tax=Streptomyces sp. NPDC049577 TaxID=3155153 RepID=UPI0034331996
MSPARGTTLLRPRGAVPAAPGRRTARVRPYSFTGGRTRLGQVLLLETFVAAPPVLDDGPEPVCAAHAVRALPEMRAIVGLCRRLRSVAEVAALLKMPLGVVRVLLGDLADQGRIRVFGTGHATGRPDRALLERVQSGLRRL